MGRRGGRCRAEAASDEQPADGGSAAASGDPAADVDPAGHGRPGRGRLGGTLAAAGLAAATPLDLTAVLVTNVVGLVACGALVSAIAGIGHRRLDRRLLRTAEAISAVAILVFAAIFAVRLAELVRAALG